MLDIARMLSWQSFVFFIKTINLANLTYHAELRHVIVKLQFSNSHISSTSVSEHKEGTGVQGTNFDNSYRPKTAKYEKRRITNLILWPNWFKIYISGMKKAAPALINGTNMFQNWFLEKKYHGLISLGGAQMQSRLVIGVTKHKHWKLA